MSASDKTKLDGIATGANKITVDSAMSSSSTNPVQNKAIVSALSAKQNGLSTPQMTGINAIAGYTLATDDEVTSVWTDAAAAS